MTGSSDTSVERPQRLRELRHGAHHAGRAAGVDHQLRRGRQRRQLALQRCGDQAGLAAAAVFRGQHHPDAQPLEPVGVVQVAHGPAAVEQRGRRALRPQRLGQRRERGQTHAAGHHPCRAGRCGDRERLPQRAEALQVRAGFQRVQRAGHHAHLLVEERETRRFTRCVAQDLEDGERPAQQRRPGVVLADHHELAGPHRGGDRGRRQLDHVVSLGKPIVRQDERIDIRRHPAQYSLRALDGPRQLTVRTVRRYDPGSNFRGSLKVARRGSQECTCQLPKRSLRFHFNSFRPR